ncbi:MAG TPA: CHAT domain-containing protein, partial [Thermoanaerobaculia bacterium]|nr:CHAT domain-containing protein [Thermoanaerobaculia bacterium]
MFIVASREQWKDKYHLLQLRRAAAEAGHRTLTARVVGWPHAPRPTSRGTASRPLEISTASAALRGSTNAHLMGTALLAGGEPEKAVDELRAEAERTHDAETLCDLSAALYTQAEELRSYDSALDAMVAARKAIAASPTLAEAHFNLALALEFLGLSTEAGQSFGQVALLEPTSGWAAEARSRAAAAREHKTDWPSVMRLLSAARNDATRKRVIRENLELARVYGEGPLFAAWAGWRMQGCPDAARDALALPRLIAAVLRETYNDVYLTDAIAAIDRAEARGEAAALQMARALVTYRNGREARTERDESRADVLLGQAADELTALGSPAQYLARYYLAGALFEQSRIDEAMKVLEKLDTAALEAKGYRAVAARVGWSRGNCLLVRGSYAEAFQQFDRSHAASVAIGEEELAAGFDVNAAQALEYLGQSREAWSRRARALRAYSSGNTNAATNKKAVALTAAANLQIAARNWERAEALLDYALQLAMKTGYHVVVVNAFAQRSVARFELGKADEAASDLGRASNRFTRIADAGVRKALRAGINSAIGASKRVVSPNAAIAYITDSIDHSTSSGQSASLPRLYAERARAHEASGDVARRRQDLRAGLAVVAAWERKIDDLEQRAATSVWGEAMRRDLITLELKARDVASAFSYADDRYTPANLAAPLPLAAVQQALAPNAAIIEFVTTGDRVIVFVIRSNVAHAITLPAGVNRIAAAAKLMRDADDAQFADAAATLHDLLLVPVLKYLDGIVTLAIVPDQELSGLPFGALRDRSRDRYLLEHIAVVHDASASAAITWSQRARAPREEKLLVIGASEFDSDRNPGAAALAQVENEARQVARFSAGAQILLGHKATPDAVRRALPEASVTHYAGHIVDRGAEARLLLARSDGRDSLSAREVGKLRLDQTRVVVLAACRG